MRKIMMIVLMVSLTFTAAFAGGTEEQTAPQEADPGDFGPYGGFGRGPGFMDLYPGDNEPGVLAASIIEDGPAAEAGVIRGDIILAIDGRAVDSLLDIHRVLSEYRGGDTVELTVNRGGEETALSLTLDDRLYHPPMGIALVPDMPRGDVRTGAFGRHSRPMYGFNSRGVFITGVTEGGPAAEAGLQAGDIITAVNGTEPGEGDLRSLVLELKSGDTVTLTVLRPGSGDAEEMEIPVTLGKTEDGKPYLGVQFFSPPAGTAPRRSMPGQFGGPGRAIMPGLAS